MIYEYNLTSSNLRELLNLIEMDECEKLTGLTSDVILSLEKQGKFPKLFSDKARILCFYREQVEDFIKPSVEIVQ